MGPLDLFTDLELFEEIKRRQDAKELAYLCYLGLDNGEDWFCMSDISYDGLQEIYEMEIEEFEENELYDSDNWTPDADTEDQFREDFED